MKRIREKCSSIYLQSAELLSLIAGYLSVNGSRWRRACSDTGPGGYETTDDQEAQEDEEDENEGRPLLECEEGFSFPSPIFLPSEMPVTCSLFSILSV